MAKKITKVKIKELINTSPSKPWWDLSKDLKRGSSIPAVSNSAVGPFISIFGTLLGAMGIFLKISKVVEVVKPVLNLAVKAAGAWANPVLIPDIVQDVVVAIQAILLSLLKTGIVKIGNLVLNYPIILQELTKDQLELLKDTIEGKREELEKSVNDTIKSFSPTITTSNSTLDNLNNELNNFAEQIENELAAYLDTIGDDDLENQVNLKVNELIEQELDFSSLTPSDDDLFKFIDTQIKNMVDSLRGQIKNNLADVEIQVELLDKNISNESKKIFEDLKDGFFSILKNIIAENKDAVLESATYKENDDINEIIKHLKKLLAIELLNAKRKYKSETALCAKKSKDCVKQIKFKKINLYDIFKLNTLEQELKGVDEFNLFDWYNNEENELNSASMDEANAIFDSKKNDIIHSLNIEEITVEKDNLEIDQIFIDTINSEEVYLANLQTKINNSLTTYFNSLVLIDKGLILSGVKNKIKETNIEFSIYSEYTDIKKTIDYKQKKMRTFMYHSLRYIVDDFYKKTTNNLEPLEISDSRSIDRKTVLLLLRKLIELFLKEVMKVSIGILIHKKTRCSKSFTEQLVIEKMNRKIKDTILSFKLNLGINLYSILETVDFNNSLEIVRNGLLLKLAEEEVQEIISKQIEFSFRYEKMNEIFKDVLKEEEKSLWMEVNRNIKMI